MADNAAYLLAQFAAMQGRDSDVEELLDAVVLASARANWERGDAGSGFTEVIGDTEQQCKPDQSDGTAVAHRARTSGHATGAPRDPVASVWLEDQMGPRAITGKRVSVGRSPALPDALDIGRALRPLRRPWLSGVHQRLDVDATVEYYTRTGTLVPRLTPAPEPWLEVIVVLDRGTAMAVWDETVRTLTKTLRALAAFRDVRVWHLEHPPGEDPVLHDHHGSALPLNRDAAHHTQPARRLLLVVTDCAAPAWRQDTLWKTLHTWGRTAPIALINPLPKRLWQHSGLDLPHTTAAATVPASPGRLLSYRRPRLLRETQDTKPWQALPVLQFDPAQILAWARTLMRTDPSGCEAVLVPATGRPPLRRRQPGPTGQATPASTDEQVRARAEAFADDRESAAVRLAIAACPLDSFTLPVLDVLRDRLVSDATLADTAEFLTAGLLTATRNESADTAYQFHSAAADHLTSLLTRDQLWDTHFALSDHLATRLQAPHGIPVILRSAHADENLAAGIRPIAYAAATTARLLGVDARDHLPDARGLSASGPTPQSPGETQRRPATAAPKRPQDRLRGELYSTLAQLFHSLLANAPSTHTARPDGPMHPESPVETTSGSGQEKNQTIGDIRKLGPTGPGLVIVVDTVASGIYSDSSARDMRARMYRVLERALEYAGVPRDAVHMNDRGDGVLIAVDGHIPSARLVGPWLMSVYEELRYENRERRTRLKLRVGMHNGHVMHDHMGIVGSAVNHATQLVDSPIARNLLDAADADLLVGASESLYEGVIRNGDGFIDPARYSPVRLQFKQGEAIAWFHMPGRPAPEISAVLTQLKRPHELASIMRDLTLLLDDVTVMLEGGRYPELTSRKKIAGLLRAVADQLDGYGGSMPSRDAAHQLSLFYDEKGVTHNSLVAEVELACQELLGAAVAGESDVEAMAGVWTLIGVELPTGLTDVTIHDVTPDTDSIVWTTVEDHGPGLALGEVRADAMLILEGFMHKGEYSDRIRVNLLWEANEHTVEVSYEQDVQLVFEGRIDSGNVDLTFRGFETPELHPNVEFRQRENEGLDVTQNVTTMWNQVSGGTFSGSSAPAHDVSDTRHNGG
ncbi:SAV_2336 N-terminal domain-related protein [Streptomyces sp. NPDC057301]|uniref:SAV_2336 N-terminal domain-related protein n=1 Tax=Streptomyces sp. NPDC057301 TaxID=3346093 RepID=UPI00362D652F